MSPRNAVLTLTNQCLKLISKLLITVLGDDIGDNYDVIAKYFANATARVLQDVLSLILGLDQLDAATRFSCLQILLREDVSQLETGVFPHFYYSKILALICNKGKGLQLLNLKGVWAKDESKLLREMVNELRELRTLIMPHIGDNSILESVGNCRYLTTLNISGDCGFTANAISKLSSTSLTVLDIGSYGKRELCQGCDASDELLATLLENLPNLKILKTYSFVGQALLKVRHKTKLLYLHDTYTTPEEAKKIVENCPNLETVYLDSPQSGVLQIMENLSHLASLKINKSENGELGHYLVERGTQLEFLNVLRNSSDSLDLCQIADLAPNLRKLEFFKTRLTVSNGERCRFENLESFEVLYCGINSHTLTSVLKGSPLLNRCVIGDIVSFSDVDLFRLCADNDFKCLNELWISCAQGLTISSVELLMGHCKNLRVLGQLNGWSCTPDDIDYLRAVIASTNVDLTLLPLTFLAEEAAEFDIL